MTYENALAWCEKNVPQEDYDNYDDWYSACQDKIATPSLFEKREFNILMENSWLANFGRFDLREQEEIPVSETTEIVMPRQTRVSNRTIITEQEAPVKIISRSPITIISIEDIRERIVPRTESAPRITPILILPKSAPIQQKQNILQKFFSLFRRKR